VLHNSKFKTRHNVIKDVVQTPREQFVRIDDYKQMFPGEFKKPKKKKQPKNQKVALPEEIQVEEQTKKERFYVIDKSKVRHRVENYAEAMKGEKLMYFWTVTFPKGTDDDQCYKMFNIWLTRLRKEKLLKDYLWVAERQQNGTIHYHMIINNRMDIKRANRYMRASIITAIDKGIIKWARHHAGNYNGVDIAKNRKTGRVINFAKQKNRKALSNYLTKYVSKSTEKFKRLAWHCSRAYSNVIIRVSLTWEEFMQFVEPTTIPEAAHVQSEFYSFFGWLHGPPDSVIKYLRYANDQVQKALLQRGSGNIHGKSGQRYLPYLGTVNG